MELFITILLAFILLGYLLRLLMPWFLKLMVRRMQKRYGFHTNGQQQQQHKREGEVTVDEHTTRPKKKKLDKNVGDYVDFEEVE